MTNRTIIGIVGLMGEGGVDGHVSDVQNQAWGWTMRFICRKSLGLGLRLCQALHWLGRLEGKKNFVNPGSDLVHPGLKVIEVFMESGIDDFIDTRE